MIVYGSKNSPFVRKVLIVIAEKGLTTDHNPVPPHDRLPEFQATSPLGKIPGFVDGDFKLSDSSAICHYLERKYPARPQLPAAPAQLGRAIWFDEFADISLWAPVLTVFRNLVLKKALKLGEPDMLAVETALKDELPPLYRCLESQIRGPYLVGDCLTLADISVASIFVSLEISGRPLDTARWPTLGDYLAPILARPSFVKARP
jgi:glutathione S-transferase